MSANASATRIFECTSKLIEPERDEEMWMEIPEDLVHSSSVKIASLLLLEQIQQLAPIADEIGLCVSKETGFSIEPRQFFAQSGSSTVVR